MITEIFKISVDSNPVTEKANNQVLSYLFNDNSLIPHFNTLLGYREQHLGHGHEDTVLPNEVDSIKNKLLAFLHDNHIVLNPAIVGQHDVSEEEAQHLLTMFKSALLADTYQASECPDCHTYVLAAKQKIITEVLQRQIMKRKLPLVKTLADGDCFYHAVFMGLLDGILTDTIRDSSITGNAIKTKLFVSLFKHILPAWDVLAHTLRENVKALLAHFSLNDHKQETSLNAMIQACDWQTLQCASAPTLRDIMNNELANHAKAKAKAATACLNEFVAHVGVTHASRLALDNDTVLRMKSQLSEGEYHAIEDTPTWLQTIAMQLKDDTTEDALRDAIKPQFNAWWNTAGFDEYCNRHAQARVYAGTPQAMALASALQLTIKQVNASTGDVVDYVTTPLADNHIIVEHRFAHFNVRVGRADTTQPHHLSRQLVQTVNRQIRAPKPQKTNRNRFFEEAGLQEKLQDTQRLLEEANALPEHPVIEAAKTCYATFFSQTRQYSEALRSGEILPGCIATASEEEIGHYAIQLEHDASIAASLQDEEIRFCLGI